MANFFIATVNESSAEVKVFFLKKRKSTLGTITGQSSVYYRKKKRTKSYLALFFFQFILYRILLSGI